MEINKSELDELSDKILKIGRFHFLYWEVAALREVRVGS